MRKVLSVLSTVSSSCPAQHVDAGVVQVVAVAGVKDAYEAADTACPPSRPRPSGDGVGQRDAAKKRRVVVDLAGRRTWTAKSWKSMLFSGLARSVRGVSSVTGREGAEPCRTHVGGDGQMLGWDAPRYTGRRRRPWPMTETTILAMPSARSSSSPYSGNRSRYGTSDDRSSRGAFDGLSS